MYAQLAAADCPPPTNTCFGDGALQSSFTGTANSAFGYQALFSDTGVGFNTAVGYIALRNNTTGSNNVAIGERSLRDNTTGGSNTAVGALALARNTTGEVNTAVGLAALASNETGIQNTAIGQSALNNVVIGSNNTAVGGAALAGAHGSDNTAIGANALSNSAGSRNIGIGNHTLELASGLRNVAVGYEAGRDIASGNDNIVIGSGNFGLAKDSQTIRIGIKTRQKKAFVAGITGVKTGLASAKTVFIDANGQLGTIKSSRNTKEDILPMASSSDRLLSLRPVTFRYKEAYEDGSKPIEFGLIAEDVAAVFPELIVNDLEGNPETVRYDLVATLLLNEFLKQHAFVQAQSKRISALESQSEELTRLKLEFARLAETISKLDGAPIVAAAD